MAKSKITQTTSKPKAIKSKAGKGKAARKTELKTKTKKTKKLKLIPRRKILKRSKSAWVFFSSSMRAETLASNPSLSFGEISKLLSPQWKALSIEERQPFVDLYVADKERYVQEKANLSDEQKKMLRLHIRSKNLKKKGRPSAVLSSYMLFVKNEHAEITKKYPDKSFLEVGKVMGAMWREMPISEREPYNTLHKGDQHRFAQEMAVYAK